jgi:hypothetical protein
MPRRLDPQEAVPLTGKTVGDFWTWALSNVLDNTSRGILAEWAVASALGVDNGVRWNWEPWDLETDGVKIEVKCAADIQSWPGAKSPPQFGIAPSTAYYRDGSYDPEKRRRADVYVLCFYSEEPEVALDAADPLDLTKWQFYVLSTRYLDEELGNQQTIRLSVVRSHAKPVGYEGLADRVFAAVGHSRSV